MLWGARVKGSTRAPGPAPHKAHRKDGFFRGQCNGRTRSSRWKKWADGRYGLRPGGSIWASDHLPILFFNGIGANIEAVAPLAAAMPERGFIMFDMPGTGESPDPLIPYNPFTMSWTAAQLLGRYGIEEADVMGVSWGGAMAQHFALQHPMRTRRLTLIATTPGMVMVPGNPAAFTKMADPRRYIDPEIHERTFRHALWRGRQGRGRAPERQPYRPAEAPFPARLHVSIAVHDGLDQSARPALHDQADADHDGGG